MAGLIVVRHALAMERAIVLTAKASVFKGMLLGFCGVACASGYEGHELALSDEAAIEEGGE